MESDAIREIQEMLNRKLLEAQAEVYRDNHLDIDNYASVSKVKLVQSIIKLVAKIAKKGGVR